MRISDWSSDVCSSDLAGVSLEEALDTTYTDTRKGALKDDLSRALTNVKTGKPWADGFRTVHPTNKAALSMATDKERLGEILEEVADENKSIYIRSLEILQPLMATIGCLSMILVYAITGLYSIVPFSELFEKLWLCWEAEGAGIQLVH